MRIFDQSNLQEVERSRNFDVHNLGTSMLVTNVRDEMCWRQHRDVGDGFRHFCHQHPLPFNISVGQQQPKEVTNISILSPPHFVSNIRHQHLKLETISQFQLLVLIKI